MATIAAIRASNQWKFFGILMHSSRALAVAWWSVLVLRGLLPALFAIAMGALVGAVQSGASLVARCLPSPWAPWWAQCSLEPRWLRLSR